MDMSNHFHAPTGKRAFGFHWVYEDVWVSKPGWTGGWVNLRASMDMTLGDSQSQYGHEAG